VALTGRVRRTARAHAIRAIHLAPMLAVVMLTPDAPAGRRGNRPRAARVIDVLAQSMGFTRGSGWLA